MKTEGALWGDGTYIRDDRVADYPIREWPKPGFQ